MERRDEEILSEESMLLVFSRLKLYCLDLLDLLRNPKKDASFLAEMADFLRRAPAAALQPSLEYALSSHPRQLVTHLTQGALVSSCREEKKADTDGGFVYGGAPLGGHAISDSTAEGMLLCLEELLKKCHLGSVNQAAELEALRGHRGSANLRKEAFLTLRVLVAKISFGYPYGHLSKYSPGLAISSSIYLVYVTFGGQMLVLLPRR
ncbi:hypothetical protein BHE74_00027689 [Ensete ventricosum]|nr:hypothetical protein BHE74_00027689 [Ensete ventricosum]RZR99515.1 hypothetical protein BHM03_00029076 [Ensete ventricosum]